MNGLWFVWRDGVGKLFGFRSLAGGEDCEGLRGMGGGVERLEFGDQAPAQ